MIVLERWCDKHIYSKVGLKFIIAGEKGNRKVHLPLHFAFQSKDELPSKCKYWKKQKIQGKKHRETPFIPHDLSADILN